MNIKKLIAALVIDAVGTAAALMYVGEEVTLPAVAVSWLAAGIVGYFLIRSTAL